MGRTSLAGGQRSSERSKKTTREAHLTTRTKPAKVPNRVCTQRLEVGTKELWETSQPLCNLAALDPDTPQAHQKGPLSLRSAQTFWREEPSQDLMHPTGSLELGRQG